jgi:hypothetical protein
MPPSRHRGSKASAPQSERRGFIGAYGLFWNVDDVSWSGRRSEHGQPFRLLGRLGKQRPGLQVCDFQSQRGIYVLHDDYAPTTLAGLVRNSNLGNRLRRHRGGSARREVASLLLVRLPPCATQGSIRMTGAAF